MNRLFSIFFLLIFTLPAFAQVDYETSAKQAIVVDYETGAVLMAKNAEERMPTSSMSKVMTMYVVFDALKRGAISMDEEFPVSEKAWRMGGSKMFVEVDSKVKIKDLVQGVIVQSGNDATVVLAEGLAGSEDNFAVRLNEAAQKLGMSESHFANASGWPDPDHYSTARDLAILARAIIANFPDYYDYWSEKEFTYNSIKQGNRNPLLYRNIGADGLKTGHTEDGGYGLIGSGVAPDGRRVIIVLNGLESQETRAQESAKLLQWGMERFESRKVLSGGEVAAEAPLVMAQEDRLPLVVQDDFKVLMPRGVTDDIEIYAEYNSPVVGPVSKGDEIGKLVVKAPGMAPVERPLYAGADAHKLGALKRAAENAKLFIKQL